MKLQTLDRIQAYQSRCDICRRNDSDTWTVKNLEPNAKWVKAQFCAICLGNAHHLKLTS